MAVTIVQEAFEEVEGQTIRYILMHQPRACLLLQEVHRQVFVQLEQVEVEEASISMVLLMVLVLELV